MLSDSVNLFFLVAASLRDAARLLGLETRLVIKTIVMMVVIAVVLGAVVVGIWLSVTLLIAAGLYEYTGLGVTLSIATASLINVVCAGILVFMLRRLIRRLAFPETRLAVRTLLDDASRKMSIEE